VVLDGVRYEYGFEYTAALVVSEWAYRYPKGKVAVLFERHGQSVHQGVKGRAEAKLVARIMGENALFLSAAAAAGYAPLLPLYAWFQQNFRLADSRNRAHRLAFTAELFDAPAQRERAFSLLQVADLGIENVFRDPGADPELLARRGALARHWLADMDGDHHAEPPQSDELGIRLQHCTAGNCVDLDLADESAGTVVWLGLVGPVLDALHRGSVLLADELDASLHPLLVSELIRLFQMPSTNPKNAQLIFNSHDSTVLGDAVTDRLLGRDQIWFTEKLPDGSARLYPLSDFDPRKQESIGKRYLSGRYGAVPIVSPGEFLSAVREA
jgi:uncharacterized protein